MRVHSWLILTFVLLAGCGKSPMQVTPERASPPSKPGPGDAFLTDLLKSHGEKNVVTTAEGVGLQGNATRLKTSLYGSKRQGDGFVVETEFRIRLASGQEIVEYVAGVGETESKAINDTLLNFTLTTFHPVYKLFMNPADPHQKVEPLMLADGTSRQMAMGDLFLRGGKQNASFDLNQMRPKIKAAIAKLPLSAGPHWIKLVYAQSKSQPVTVAVTLDNSDQEDLTSAVKALDWPRQDKFYMVKQFIALE